MGDGLKGLLPKPPHLLGTKSVCSLACTIKFDFDVMKTTQDFFFFLERIFYYQTNPMYLLNIHYIVRTNICYNKVEKD